MDHLKDLLKKKFSEFRVVDVTASLTADTALRYYDALDTNKKDVFIASKTSKNEKVFRAYNMHPNKYIVFSRGGRCYAFSDHDPPSKEQMEAFLKHDLTDQKCSYCRVNKCQGRCRRCPAVFCMSCFLDILSKQKDLEMPPGRGTRTIKGTFQCASCKSTWKTEVEVNEAALSQAARKRAHG